jgi:tRNA A58 N-methylase Trm61
MMDSPRAKTALNNLKPSSLAENHVLLGHTDVIKFNLCMTVRRILVLDIEKPWIYIVSHNGGMSNYFDSRIRKRDNNDRLLSI